MEKTSTALSGMRRKEDIPLLAGYIDTEHRETVVKCLGKIKGWDDAKIWIKYGTEETVEYLMSVLKANIKKNDAYYVKKYAGILRGMYQRGRGKEQLGGMVGKKLLGYYDSRSSTCPGDHSDQAANIF